MEIGDTFLTPYNSTEAKPTPSDSLLLYPLTAKSDSPIITNKEALVTEIHLVDDDPEKKVMTLKYADQLYVKFYYSFQPEYKVGDVIPAGKTIAQYSSGNETLLILEVLKAGQRQLVQNYIQLESN